MERLKGFLFSVMILSCLASPFYTDLEAIYMFGYALVWITIVYMGFIYVVVEKLNEELGKLLLKSGKRPENYIGSATAIVLLLATDSPITAACYLMLVLFGFGARAHLAKKYGKAA